MALVGWTPSCPPQVVHDFVYLRQEPSLHAPILGKRQRGDTFHASEETWDGWVKLHGQPGSLTFYLLVLSREWMGMGDWDDY